jgi:hypothetical protein
MFKNKEEKKKKKESDKSPAETSIVENNDSGEALMITSNNEKCMSWVLDSACSFHICSQREWFSDYSNAHTGDIIGDESPHEISRISSIQIKIYDGTLKTLTNVCLFFGTLEALGFKIYVNNGVLKISQDNYIV